MWYIYGVEMAATQSKERILAGAKELFLARGYAATTVDAICEKAELTKGSFYACCGNYFAGGPRLDDKRLFLNSDHLDSSPIWKRIFGRVLHSCFLNESGSSSFFTCDPSIRPVLW
jgi:Bacterial regulatory proteins, tetR family